MVDVPSGIKVNKGRLVKVALCSLLGSLILLGIVFWQADWDLLITSLSNCSLSWLAGAAVGLVLTQFVSGLRLAFLLPREDGAVLPVYGAAVEVSFLYQVLIKLLPFRLGEVAYFWLGKKKLNASFDRNISVFLRFRLWDLRIVAISFLTCGGWIVATQYAWLRGYIVVAAVLGMAFFMLSPANILGILEKIFHLLKRLPGFGFLHHFSEIVAQAIAHVNDAEHQVSELTLFWQTILVWLCYYTVFYCLMQGIGMEVSVMLAIAVSSGMTLISIVPIQTIGGIGLVEIGQSSLYMLAGLPTSEAASRSLTVSALFLGLCILIPCLMWISFYVVRKVAATFSS